MHFRAVVYREEQVGLRGEAGEELFVYREVVVSEIISALLRMAEHIENVPAGPPQG